MKILMITDKMDIGGAETHIVTLISELIKMGVRITLISSGGVYIKDLNRLGVSCIYAPLDKRDPISVGASKRIIREEMKRCNIVHAHTRFSAYLSRSVRGERRYPPILVTAHLNFPTFPFGPLTYWGDETLAVSQDIKEYLMQSYGIPENKIHLTRNAIDLRSFAGKRQEKKLIIHTSRIDTGRARVAFALADIAEELMKKHPDHRILIVGDGNEYASLKKRCDAVNSNLGYEGIILTGARSDIPSILRYGEIFVGVSRSALEGMATGLATVIAGDEGYGGIIDEENFDLLAKSNFCARGLPKTDPAVLLRDIDKLIKSPTLRDAIGTFYRKKLGTEYSADLMAKDAYLAYKRLITAPKVCLMGYFGFSNLGDEITLSAAKDILQKHSISKISVLTGNPDGENPLGVKLYDRSSPVDIARAVNECDIFVMCGGNLLQNETSERSLLYYEQLLRYVRSRGKSIYMLSSGFGEVRGGLGRYLLARGIRASSFCGCRTTYDLRVARLCGAENTRLMPDFCFLLQEENKCHDTAYFAYIPSRDARISPDELLAISNKRGIPAVVIILFPNEDKNISGAFCDLGISCYFPKSYDKIKSLLSKCTFTITERLHGAIFSILTHTPSYISMATAKNRALLGEVKRHPSGNALLLPYTLEDVMAKKEIGARDSDFKNVIKSFKEKIIDGITEAF